MKSSSCTQPFTEYNAQFQSILYRTFLCVLSPSFEIDVLQNMTLAVAYCTCSKTVCKLGLRKRVISLAVKSCSGSMGNRTQWNFIDKEIPCKFILVTCMY